MNRLWVRLSLAFGLFIIITMLIIAAAAQALVHDGLRQSFLRAQLNRPNGMVERLANYYQENQGWDGVDSFIKRAQAFSPFGQSQGVQFILEDAQHRMIFHSGNLAKPLPPDFIVTALPIRVNKEIVGHLLAATRRRARPTFPQFRRTPGESIVEWISGLLFGMAIIGTVVGLGVSVLISRGLTAPLRRMADAARAIGRRDFTQRVDPVGSEEIQEVAHAFNEMASGLEEAETLRRNLVADVAHELRTPLSVLQGNLRAILDDLYPLDKAEIVRLYDQTRLLNRLVDDLREVAQAEAGQLQLSVTSTDLNGLVKDAVDTFRPAAEEAQIDLTVSVQKGLSEIPLDAGRIRQVLNNLIGNALQHTPKGGTISVSTVGNDDAVTFVVRDSGEGIDPQQVGRIFDRFYRTDSARARNSGGSGLGLAIAQAIVKAHGGSIVAGSDGLGRGATFTVQLPRICSAGRYPATIV